MEESETATHARTHANNWYNKVQSKFCDTTLYLFGMEDFSTK